MEKDKTKVEQTIKYYRKNPRIQKQVLRHIPGKDIVYGSYALNKQLPKLLRTKPGDIDIYSRNPKVEAVQTEKQLDRYVGFNAFRVEKAEHPGTFKVKSKVTGKTIVDYSKPENHIPTRRINHIRYATLEYAKKKALEALHNPEAKFRHDKDLDAYNRILAAERLRHIKHHHKIRRNLGWESIK